MASPVVAATSTPSRQTSAVTSHVVNLPSGIANGHRLVAYFLTPSHSAVYTWPAGWNTIFDQNSGGTTSAHSRLIIAYKNADGTESGSITVTADVSSRSAHICDRITGHDPSTAPQAATKTTGTNANPDPGTISPTGGSKDYLFIAVGGLDDSTTVSAAPSSYGGLTSINDTNDGTIATANRQLTTASEDPASFTFGVAANWVSTVVAIHPSTGATTHSAAVAFAGAGTAAITASVLRAAAVNFQGAGTFASAAGVVQPASVGFTGAATFAGSASVVHAAGVDFEGAGTFGATATIAHAAAISFSGAAVFDAAGEIIPPGPQMHQAAVAFSGVGLFDATAAVIRAAQVSYAAAASFGAQAGILHPASVSFQGAAVFGASAGLVLGASVSFVASATFSALAQTPPLIVIGPDVRDRSPTMVVRDLSPTMTVRMRT